MIQRKIIKNAVISIRTNNIDSFISSVNRDVNKTGGFVEELYDDTGKNRNVNMTLKIPADKLDEFLNSLSAKGTVESKNISNSDITDSYIETQSKINALEAEEKALLKLLESAENLSDVISLQDRLSQVRESLKAAKHRSRLLTLRSVTQR